MKEPLWETKYNKLNKNRKGLNFKLVLMPLNKLEWENLLKKKFGTEIIFPPGKNIVALVRIALPFHIPLKDSEFLIKKFGCLLKLEEKKQSHFDERLFIDAEKSKNIVLLKDKMGYTHYSEVWLKYATKIDKFRNNIDKFLLTTFLEELVQILNHFISIVRTTAEVYYLHPLKMEDFMLVCHKLYIKDEAKPLSAFTSFFGGRPITSEDVEYPMVAEVQSWCKHGKSPLLSQELLVQAKDYFFSKQYRLAYIEANISLEALLYELIEALEGIDYRPTKKFRTIEDMINHLREIPNKLPCIQDRKNFLGEINKYRDVRASLVHGRINKVTSPETEQLIQLIEEFREYASDYILLNYSIDLSM